MSERVTFVCHGPTSATRRTRFPQDEPLEPGAVGTAPTVADPVADPADPAGPALPAPARPGPALPGPALPGSDPAGAALHGPALARSALRGLALTSPALRCRQTAAALGLTVTSDAAPADWDLGSWAGRSLDEVGADTPDQVRAWVGDPDAAPHGGESLRALLARVGDWLDDPPQPRPDRCTVVTHPAVIRAAVVHALQAPAASFWRVDVAPLAVVELRGRPGRWSLHP